MKNLLKTLAISLLLGLSPQLHADDGLPLDEAGFVDAIPHLSKAQITERLGEPTESIVVTDDRSGDIIGLIWLYEYLNTNADGDYYKSTELDLIDDKVVNIIFSNSSFGSLETAAATSTECTPSC